MSEPRLTLEPGEAAVILREQRTGPHSITDVTIDRVLKRDVVCSNDERFNATHLSRSNGTWEASTELLHPDDERVARARAENALLRFVRTTRARIAEADVLVGKDALLDARERLVTALELVDAEMDRRTTRSTI